jgi:RNA polymerase sigma-70 factor (ECF subfamily)
LDASTESDAELVRRVLAGERERFETLVDRHARALYAILRGRLRSAEDAREAFQETWLRAFESLSSLRDGERFRAWLVSIARNELKRAARRSGAREPESEPADPAPGPLALARDRELARILAAEIAALPARQREVFRLRVAGGLAHAEIAALLGISEESARVHHHLAVRRLRERMTRSRPVEKT